MQNGEKTFTRAGNMRSPGYGLVINWISAAWDELDQDIILRTFQLCGITQSNFDDCHTQLRAFMDSGETDMVVDDDGSNEVRGFEDEVLDDQDDDDEESEAESEEDLETE